MDIGFQKKDQITKIVDKKRALVSGQVVLKIFKGNIILFHEELKIKHIQ